MKVYKIQKIKLFTDSLFTGEVFDNFLLTEAEFVTSYTVMLSGRKTSASEGEDEFITWNQSRPLAFSAVKGKELPKSFKIVLKLSLTNTANTIKALNLTTDDTPGLYLNIRYENGELLLVTGTSTSSFLISKELDSGFEKFISLFLVKNNIEYTEI